MISEFFVYIKPAGSYEKFRACTIPRTISDNSTYFNFGPIPHPLPLNREGEIKCAARRMLSELGLSFNTASPLRYP